MPDDLRIIMPRPGGRITVPQPRMGVGYGQRIYDGPIEPIHRAQAAQAARESLRQLARVASDAADAFGKMADRRQSERCFTHGLPMRGLSVFNEGEGDEGTGHAFRSGCCPDNGFCACGSGCSMEPHLIDDAGREERARNLAGYTAAVRAYILEGWNKGNPNA